MAQFRSAPGGATLILDEVESALLRQLAAEMKAMLSAGSDDDPVSSRLFPDAYETAEDEDAYRDMTHDDLTRYKLEALDAVSSAVGSGEAEVTLRDEDLERWLACLTDLRLAIGTRLGVDEARMTADIEPGDPDESALTVLHWLGWLQEGLLRSIA